MTTHDFLRPEALVLGLLLSFTSACVEELGFDDEGDGASDGGGTIDIEQDGDVSAAAIDATSETEWVYLDLEAGAEVGLDGSWDLGFRRFAIILNGGVSGDAGHEATYVDGVDLDELAAAPEDAAWATDEADADDDGEPELVFIDWYAYDIVTHVLTPKPRVYIVRTVEDAQLAIQIDRYYSESGTPGELSVRWKSFGG